MMTSMELVTECNKAQINYEMCQSFTTWNGRARMWGTSAWL